LTDDEIVAFWKACEKLGWPFGVCCQLMLLTGQRESEVAGMRWTELETTSRKVKVKAKIDGQEQETEREVGLVWRLPRERPVPGAKGVKNSKAHDVALSALALSIIENPDPQKMPHFDTPPPRDFLFTVRAGRPITSFDFAKQKLDALMTLETPWRLHDLRRTATTGMAELGFAPHIIDKILNHQSGTISGTAAIYNRFNYYDERRAALEAWGRHIEALIGSKPASVAA
jgi:integrase